MSSGMTKMTFGRVFDPAERAEKLDNSKSGKMSSWVGFILYTDRK